MKGHTRRTALLFALLVINLTIPCCAQFDELLFMLGGPNAPPGYMYASLSDVKSDAFLAHYNVSGLADSGEVMPFGHMDVISVVDGILSVGSLSSPGYLAPYGTSRQLQNSTILVSPVWFGTLPYQGQSGHFIGALDPATVQKLHAVPINTTESFYFIYVRASFFVAAQRRASLPKRAQLASIGDLQSTSFADLYNSGKLMPFKGSSVGDDQCCAFYLREGYLTLSRQFLVPYSDAKTDNCGASSLPSTAVWFGTSAQFIGLLNTSVQSMLKATHQFPNMCPSDSTNSWAIYKVPQVGPGPAPQGNCLKVELQVSFYTPSSGPCLADKWDYVIQFGRVYSSIPMDDFDTCGSSVNMYGLVVSLHSDTHYVANTTGGSGCDCKGWNWLPVEKTSSMTTICKKTIGTFGFCMVEIDAILREECP